MEIKPNTLPPQDSGMYDQNLSLKLESLVIPSRIFLKSSSDFDDKHIHNDGDEWVFYYSGSKRYVYFKLDELTNALLKYFCFKYASTMFPTVLPILSYQWTQAFSYCRGNGGFTLLILRQYIESDGLDARAFYSILFGLKILCSEEFPGFTLEDYEDLEFIPRPNTYNWEIYQDIDNLLDPFEKNMIGKGLFAMATALAKGKFYDIRELKHAAILGLSYVTGARPVQLAKLAVRDLRIDTCNTNTGLIRYSILLPYVKQRRLTTERLLLAIPPEIGALIKHYVDRAQLLSNGKMFDMGVSAPAFVSQSISQTILNFSPPDYQIAVARGEAAPPSITPTDLRHNVGHSLAMQGASAEEIAHILGHSSLVVAKHYILATPALALIRAKALGSNPVWQNMVAMMLTGKLVPSKEWLGRRVVGMVGDRLHYEVGGCARTDDECPFSEVRCCYGCLYYRPFLDGHHQDVLDSITKEVDELIAVSDSVGNAHNPLISIHETTQIEIKSVIARCHLHNARGCGK
ncbi:site-specific integrase [Klebsiella aerogenes]|nr:site-specific integrase [Klebsiella aerogenes]